MSVPNDLTALFRSELELCRVTTNVPVPPLTAGDLRSDYAQAFEAASGQLGARCFQLRIPVPASADRQASRAHARESLNENSAAIGALSGADIVIDLLNMVWSRAQVAILASG